MKVLFVLSDWCISITVQADRALNKAYSSAAKAEAADEAAAALTGEALVATKKKNNSPKIVRSGAKAALACLTSKLAQDAERALKAWQASALSETQGTVVHRCS